MNNKKRTGGGWVESEAKRPLRMSIEDEEDDEEERKLSKEVAKQHASKTTSSQGKSVAPTVKSGKQPLEAAKSSKPAAATTTDSSMSLPPKPANPTQATTSAPKPVALPQQSQGHMIEVLLNDRLGKKIKVKCNSDDTVGDLKKLTAAQIGSRPEKLRIQKWYTVFKDHITLDDYEVSNGMSLELYYN